LSKVSAARAKTNKAGITLGWFGTVPLIIGLIVGFTESSSCGSPFIPDSSIARLRDAVGGGNSAARCGEVLASGTMWAWFFTILGVLLIILGIVLNVVLNRQTSTSAPVSPESEYGGQHKQLSIRERLIELNDLKSQQLITDEEYEKKRDDLLRGL
jgi:hypothetical protein